MMCLTFVDVVARYLFNSPIRGGFELTDRKSTRLNSSHGHISYAVFCLKKKNLRANPRRTAFPGRLTARKGRPTGYETAFSPWAQPDPRGRSAAGQCPTISRRSVYAWLL